MIRDGEDPRRLRELDLKLWMALAVPATRPGLDRVTALLLEPGDSVPVSGIADGARAASRRRARGLPVVPPQPGCVL